MSEISRVLRKTRSLRRVQICSRPETLSWRRTSAGRNTHRYLLSFHFHAFLLFTPMSLALMVPLTQDNKPQKPKETDSDRRRSKVSVRSSQSTGNSFITTSSGVNPAFSGYFSRRLSGLSRCHVWRFLPV